MLKSLEVKNFKNLNYSIDLSEGVNIVFAQNGSGKTNTLEAVYILANGGSFHSYPEKHLINFKENVEFMKIKGALHEDEVEVVISPKGESVEKKLKVNGVNKSSANFTKLFDVIFFSPNTVDLVSGAPDLRRKDLDDFLSKIDYKYRANQNTYKKVVRNRNKLLGKLKAGFGSLEELDFWNEKMIQTGKYILEKRIELVDRIEKDVRFLSKELFDVQFDNFELTYQTKVSLDNPEESLRNLMIENLDTEIFAASSLYGPHRDDIKFKIDNMDLKIIGSRGQQRLAALIYKIALWNIIKSDKAKQPTILLDDIMSELDSHHRSRIEDLINQNYFSQVIITSCDENDFGKMFWNNSNVINLNPDPSQS